MYLLSPHTPQFKANLHSHSTLSDGRLTPEELKRTYKQHGYQILAITDHEAPKDHSALSDGDFLCLTGYEAYIRPDPGCAYDVFSPETHLNLFARDPHNEILICYNPAYCKYLSTEEQHALPKAGSERTREYSVDYINEFIRTAREHGYLVAYNHPVWSMESEEHLMAYEGFFSMEIVNGNSYCINHLEYNGALYDKLLCNGKGVYIHAADDNHNKYPFDDPQCDSFRAATMILADKLCYGDVIDAMENGNMYATMGPTFQEISFDGSHVHIVCSDVQAITCHIGSKHPASVQAEAGHTICHAVIPLHPHARYLRVSIMDERGRYADTRAFSRQELGLPPLE